MPGPLTSFIDTLQQRQPLRGLLGMQRRPSPMPLPQDRPTVAPVAMQEPLPEPPETIATPQPVDERQPDKGMGIVEAMFTPHSMALDRQRRRARGQTGVAPGSSTALAGSIRSITDDPELDEVTKLKRLADVTALAAIEATDNDQRKTLMRVSENY